MAKTNPENLPAVNTAETAQATPLVTALHGQSVVSSQQIAEHFGKRHRDVTRAIRNILEIVGEQGARNFAHTLTETTMAGAPKMAGSKRLDPVYMVTRDGFALLAMGFTGKEAMRWKLAYIRAFNLMEAKLRQIFMEPLRIQGEPRKGLRLRSLVVLTEQSRKAMAALLTEQDPKARRNLYLELKQINDVLGRPTEGPVSLLGDEGRPLLGLNGDMEGLDDADDDDDLAACAA